MQDISYCTSKTPRGTHAARILEAEQACSCVTMSTGQTGNTRSAHLGDHGGRVACELETLKVAHHGAQRVLRLYAVHKQIPAPNGYAMMMCDS